MRVCCLGPSLQNRAVLPVGPLVVRKDRCPAHCHLEGWMPCPEYSPAPASTCQGNSSPAAPAHEGLPGQNWDGAGFCPSQYLPALCCRRLRELKHQTPEGQKGPQESSGSTPPCSLEVAWAACSSLRRQLTAPQRRHLQPAAVWGWQSAVPAGSAWCMETAWYGVSPFRTLWGDGVGRGRRQSGSPVEELGQT